MGEMDFETILNEMRNLHDEAIEKIRTSILRDKMGGDKGIHLVVSPEQDPLIQEGVKL
jgi:hypothetical protein